MKNITLNRRYGYRSKTAKIINRRMQKGRHVIAYKH